MKGSNSMTQAKRSSGNMSRTQPIKLHKPRSAKELRDSFQKKLGKRCGSKILAEYQDKYGDKRVIHKYKGEMRHLRTSVTASVLMTRAIGHLIGEKIRCAREARGMSMSELCMRAGLSSSHPKNRIWEIEQGVRADGIKLGTVYALAMALDVSPLALMPSTAEVTNLLDVRAVTPPPVLTVVGHDVPMSTVGLLNGKSVASA